MTKGITGREPDPREVYGDIIDHPHWESPTHPPMSLYDRAAQFSAYDALAGYFDMIAEEARLTDAELLLDEDERELLNRELAHIEEAIRAGRQPRVTFTVFVPDPWKAGGSYQEITAAVRKLDLVGRRVVLSDRRADTGANETLDVERIVAIRREPEEADAET